MTGASAADLAVVIVNFNTGDWLARCLRSLEAARGEPRASTCSSSTTPPVTASADGGRGAPASG